MAGEKRYRRHFETKKRDLHLQSDLRRSFLGQNKRQSVSSASLLILGQKASPCAPT